RNFLSPCSPCSHSSPVEISSSSDLCALCVKSELFRSPPCSAHTISGRMNSAIRCCSKAGECAIAGLRRRPRVFDLHAQPESETGKNSRVLQRVTRIAGIADPARDFK
ncbi:hypothetical protein, partial [Povalibacter sp.]|uniref:hypothetical protein n=1 Tax=Povalibacter sp. TaxID=1962978 RepID=UPI002D1FB10D